jgi:hypothetical protein
VAAAVLGLAAGAIVAASAFTAGGRLVGPPPRLALAVLLLLLALAIATGAFPSFFGGSAWRVPRRWGRLPGPLYPGVFGLVLGLGFVTASPSPALFGWAVASMSLGSWEQAVLVFGSFAAMRALTLVAVATAAGRGLDGQAFLDGLTSLTRVVPWLEATLLLAVAAVYLS